MKCYLHIGTEKTATTTIQDFFNLNRMKLLENGYIYTQSAGRANNRKLSAAAYNLDRRDDFTMNHGLNSNDKLNVFQVNQIAGLKDEVESIQRDYPQAKSIIFSSEHIQSRLTDVREIERLKDILIHLGVVEIKIIIYLRRPADIANSLYSTSIKSGSTAINPPKPSSPYWNNLCNHKRTIEKFSLVFGESAIVPRIFDKREFFNGSVIDDILSVIGIRNDGYDLPKNANESLSLIGINLLRRINKEIPMFIDDKPNKIRENVVTYLEKYFSESKYIMPNSLYEEYDSEFLDSNEWVRRKYFPHKDVLFSSGIPKGVALNISESELDKIAGLISCIWREKQQKIINLTNQLNFVAKKNDS